MEERPVRISEHAGFKKFEQHQKGWIGSGFVHAHYEVEARRVITSDRNQTQIQFNVTEFKGEKERAYRMCGSLTLTPEQAKELAQAIYPEGFTL